MIRKCLICEKEFKTCNYHIVRNHGIFCSQKCFGIHKKKIKRLTKPCIKCGKVFETYKKYERKYCSEKCYYSVIGLWRKGKKFPYKPRNKDINGKNNPNWRGGRRFDSLGYILIYKPTHPLATKSGNVYEHRFVMEKHIGRYLNPEERVHHINKIKHDNRIKNLKLFKNESEHQIFHNFHTIGSRS